MAKRLALYTIALALVTLVAPFFARVDAQDAPVSDGQRLAYLTKPAVVRIYDGFIGTWRLANGNTVDTQYVGSGSGSIINPDGYILTNAHVTELTHDGEDKGKQILFEQLVRTLAQRANVDPDRAVRDSDILQSVRENSSLASFQPVHIVVLPNGETFPFEIKDFGAPVGQGKDVSIVKIEVKNAPTLKVGDSDSVQLQDHVTVFGYPAAADTDDSGILSRKSALEASITDGKLSAKKTTSEGAPILQISAPATHGNSGGPVLTDKGEVIGLLTFRGDTVNGQEVSGFAFVVPTNTASEFIKKAGTTNTQGLTDQRYREGLDLYFQGYYSKAIPKFEEVKRLFPQHSEIDRLLTDSQQKIAEGKDRTNYLPWVIGAVVLVLFGLVVVVGVAFVLLRRGKKPSVAQQPSFAGAPGGYAPQQQSFPPQQQQSFPPQSQASFPPQQPQAFQPQQMSPAVGGDKTMVVSAVGGAAAQAGFGAITCTSGALAGQRFEIRPEGLYIGRDGTLSQVVISDNRVSKRHVWVGPRNGRVAVVDQGSTNGTFLNVPGSQRITEVFLNPGDTIVVSEADVARFQYQR
jgi:serine protease Do